MQQFITVQTLPPEQFRTIQINQAFLIFKDLVAKCVETFQYDVELFQDKECNCAIDSQQSLQQMILNTYIIYARRVNQRFNSSAFPQVTCWFIQDGIELTQGVIMNSDFTFEEVLEEALAKQIITQIPQSIIVTDFEQTTIKATLIQMQMCRIISFEEEDAQLIIHFTTTGFQPLVQLKPKNFTHQNNFQFKPPLQQQMNQKTLQHFNPQSQVNNFPIFSLQSKPNNNNLFNININNINNNNNNNNNNNITNSISNSKFFMPSNIPENVKIFQPMKFELNQNNNKNFQNVNTQLNQQQFLNNFVKFQIQKEPIQSQEDIAKQEIEKIIILGKFIIKINEAGNCVVYHCNFPKISGYFLEIKGKQSSLKNENMFKWVNKFGVQIAQNLSNGFVIKWKNNTYNSLTISLF